MSTPVIVLLSMIAIIAAAVMFALASPLWIRIKYEDKLTVTAGLSFIRFKLYPGDKKKEKPKRRRGERTKSKASNTSAGIQPTQAEKTEKDEPKKKSSVLDTINLVFDLLKSFTNMLGKSAKIEVEKLICTVSRPEAAETAIQFGLCSGVVSTILAFCGEFGKCRINGKSVGTNIDFLSGKSSLEADIILSARTFSVLASLIRGYITNLMRK